MSPETTTRTDLLRALAEKATPGPWTPDILDEYYDDDHPIATGWFRDGPGKVDVGDYNTLTADDACYIAAVDPQTVLSLLDERDVLFGLLTEWRDASLNEDLAELGDLTSRTTDLLDGEATA